MNTSASTGLSPFVDRLSRGAHLSAEERDAVLALPTSARQIKARYDLARPGDERTHASLVTSGLIARYQTTMNGARQITGLYIAGDMIDLHAAVEPILPDGLTALCDATVLRIPQAAIRSLAASHTCLAEAFWRESAIDTAITRQWVVNVGRRDARTRVAHILCEMAVRHGEDGRPAHRYPLPMTQEQLGDATALTGVHVNRTLKSMSDVASLAYGLVSIHDWTLLSGNCGFDARYLGLRAHQPA